MRKYSSQWDMKHSQNQFALARTVEAQTIHLKGRSERDIAQHGTKFVKSVVEEDTLKLFVKSLKTLQLMRTYA